MSAPKKGGGKKSKKPKTFNDLWNKLVGKDKKKQSDGVPSDRTVKRAVAKVAKNLHLKKKERQQVTSVLAAEVQQQAHDQKHAQQHQQRQVAVKPGEDAFPVALQSGLFEQGPGGAEAAPAAEPGAEPGADVQASGSAKSYPPEAYGEQPASITLDEKAVNEIKQHMLMSMLQNVLVEQSARKPPANQKRPEDMTPDELIELRKSNPGEWNALVRENTVVSYALSKSRADDQKKAKKIKEKASGKRKPLKFDDRVEVAKAPVGKDFDPNEKKTTINVTLKRK